MFHLYGFFIGLAIVVGYSLAEYLESRIKEGAIWVIAAGIIGARIYHVIDYYTYYSSHISEILQIWNGGLSIWGAILTGSLATVVIYRRDTIQVMGAVITAMPLSQAIGRLGNAVNHEFTNRVLGIPWWGAEAILDLLLFGVIVGLTKGGAIPIVKIGVYIVGYGLIRYFLQPYRT